MEAPAIENSMILRDAQLKIIGAGAIRDKAHERSRTPFKLPLQLGANAIVNAAILLVRPEARQIVRLQRRVHVAMDYLQRLTETRQVERCSQYRVSRDQLVDGGAKGRGLEPALHPMRRRIVVGRS